MDIQAKVDQEMIRAAKEKNRERLSALRLMKNALHNREIDVKGRLDEKEALMVFSTMIKQRKDSIEQFRAGRREDLAVKEEAELRVIQEFMQRAFRRGNRRMHRKGHRRDRRGRREGHGEGDEAVDAVDYGTGGRKGGQRESQEKADGKIEPHFFRIPGIAGSPWTEVSRGTIGFSPLKGHGE